jgi:nucleoside-diphosphate-sugar epimerase
MRVLITGAAGYVGRYLTWKLEERHTLRLADSMEPDPDRTPWVYDALQVKRTPQFTPRPSSAIPFIKGDIGDLEYCRRLTKDVDAVIHLTGHVKPNEDPYDCFRVNAMGTFAVIQAAAENGVPRVLAASSINAAGWFYNRVTDRPRNWPYLPVDEAIPTDHEDAYSLAKYVNELNCEAWSNRTGMTTAAFRFSGVFPPEWTMSYEKLVQPTTEWPGELGNYVDLRDVVRALTQALECPTLPRTGVYQLSAPDTTLPEPTMELIERFRPELLKVVREPLPGRTSMLSYRRAREAFGYNPVHCWRAV